MKRYWILLLAAALLLTGCNRTEPANETVTPAPTEASVAGPPAPTEEPEPEPAPVREDPIQIDPALYSPHDYRYTLLDTEEVTVTIEFAKRLSGGPCVVLAVENRAAERRTVRFNHLTLNGSVQTDFVSFGFVSAEAGSTIRKDLPVFTEICDLIGFETIRELCVDIAVDREYESVAEPVPCRIAFPDGIHPHYAYDAYMDMRADRQILRADDSVTIALLGCGRFVGSENSFTDNLTGLVWIENSGDKEIPAKASGVLINGIFFDVYSDMVKLASGMSCILDFSVTRDKLETAGVQSIETLGLQILTSEAENSADWGREGGSVYPVMPAQSGVVADPEEGGTVVYEDDLLTITLLRTKIERHTGWNDREYNVASYVVSVENRREEGICVEFADSLVDGEPYRDAVLPGFGFQSMLEVGPQSKGVLKIDLYMTPDAGPMRIPEFSFRIEVYAQGRDAIFYTTEERIVLSDDLH